MTNVDKMFEELEYKKNPNITKEGYEEYNKFMDDCNIVTIQFWNDKTVSKVDDYDINYYITMQELKAINEKCKELRVVR